MSDDILRAARQELQRLETELAKSPLYRRLEAVRRVIELYENEPLAGARHRVRPTPAAPTPQLRAHGTKTAEIVRAAIEYLRQKGTRATSGELVQALTDMGITVGGKKPSATMASYLSNSKAFDNVSGQGYGLREWSTPAAGRSAESETPDSGKLSGASPNGTLPLNS